MSSVLSDGCWSDCDVEGDGAWRSCGIWGVRVCDESFLDGWVGLERESDDILCFSDVM